MRTTGIGWRHLPLVIVSAWVLTTLAGHATAIAGAHDTARREFQIVAADFSFSPARLEVSQHDLVRIHLHARDIAHSFVLDDYRLAKRAAAGETAVLEFRASQVGTFPFYCNLTLDRRCEQMRGVLVVSAQ